MFYLQFLKGEVGNGQTPSLITDETKTKAWFSLSQTLSMGEVSCLYVYISNGVDVMNESIKNLCIFLQIQILSLESRLQYILTIPKTSRYEYL